MNVVLYYIWTGLTTSGALCEEEVYKYNIGEHNYRHSKWSAVCCLFAYTENFRFYEPHLCRHSFCLEPLTSQEHLINSAWLQRLRRPPKHKFGDLVRRNVVFFTHPEVKRSWSWKGLSWNTNSKPLFNVLFWILKNKPWGWTWEFFSSKRGGLYLTKDGRVSA